VFPAGSIRDSGAPGSTYRAANKRTFTTARQCTNQRPGPGAATNHFEITLFMRSALHKYAAGMCRNHLAVDVNTGQGEGQVIWVIKVPSCFDIHYASCDMRPVRNR